MVKKYILTTVGILFLPFVWFTAISTIGNFDQIGFWKSIGYCAGISLLVLYAVDSKDFNSKSYLLIFFSSSILMDIIYIYDNYLHH